MEVVKKGNVISFRTALAQAKDTEDSKSLHFQNDLVGRAKQVFEEMATNAYYTHTYTTAGIGETVGTLKEKLELSNGEYYVAKISFELPKENEKTVSNISFGQLYRVCAGEKDYGVHDLFYLSCDQTVEVKLTGKHGSYGVEIFEDDCVYSDVASKEANDLRYHEETRKYVSELLYGVKEKEKGFTEAVTREYGLAVQENMLRF